MKKSGDILKKLKKNMCVMIFFCIFESEMTVE